MLQPDEDTFGEPLRVLYVVSSLTVCRNINIHAGVRASAGVLGKNASQERKRHAVGLLEVRISFVKGLDGSLRSHQPVSGFAGKADACLSFFSFSFSGKCREASVPKVFVAFRIVRRLASAADFRLFSLDLG